MKTVEYDKSVELALLCARALTIKTLHLRHENELLGGLIHARAL